MSCTARDTRVREESEENYYHLFNKLMPLLVATEKCDVAEVKKQLKDSFMEENAAAGNNRILGLPLQKVVSVDTKSRELILNTLLEVPAIQKGYLPWPVLKWVMNYGYLSTFRNMLKIPNFRDQIKIMCSDRNPHFNAAYDILLNISEDIIKILAQEEPVILDLLEKQLKRFIVEDKGQMLEGHGNTSFIKLELIKFEKFLMSFEAARNAVSDSAPVVVTTAVIPPRPIIHSNNPGASVTTAAMPSLRTSATTPQVGATKGK